MTAEQKSWLDRNKNYRMVGTRGGNSTWSRVGMLHEDGIFEPHVRGQRPNVRQGSFEVGILTVPQAHEPTLR
jgi:hypothetical protein